MLAAVLVNLSVLAGLLAVALISSGASGSGRSLNSSGAVPATAARTLAVGAPEKCPSARGAVRFYSRRIAEHRAKMGAGPQRRFRDVPPCPRYLAHVLQRKARAWRLRVERWFAYHYDWRSWLPANWRRLGACETGYGSEPGNWRHENSRFVSAFGISRAVYGSNAARAGYLGWEETKRRLHRYPTPREQYANGLSHLAFYGDGWTCPGP